MMAVGSLLWFQCLHVSIDPTRIAVGAAIAPYSRSDEYGEVEFVRTAPEFKTPIGKVKRQKAIAIGFSDGRVWGTRDLPTGLSARQIEHIAQVVSRKAGLVIERKKTLTGSGR